MGLMTLWNLSKLLSLLMALNYQFSNVINSYDISSVTVFLDMSPKEVSNFITVSCSKLRYMHLSYFIPIFIHFDFLILLQPFAFLLNLFYSINF